MKRRTGDAPPTEFRIQRLCEQCRRLPAAHGNHGCCPKCRPLWRDALTAGLVAVADVVVLAVFFALVSF